MAYGLRTRARIAEAPSPAPDRLDRRWEQLSEACRLDLVERALVPGRFSESLRPAA